MHVRALNGRSRTLVSHARLTAAAAIALMLAACTGGPSVGPPVASTSNLAAPTTPVEAQPLEGDDLPDWLAGWDAIRADKAGMVYYYLLKLHEKAA